MTAPFIAQLNAVQNGSEAFIRPSGWTDIVQSTATHAEYDLVAARVAMGLPAGFPLLVIFSADGPFWANFFNNAAVPSGNITNGTGSEFSPNQRALGAAVSKISLVSANNCNVSMQFFTQ